MLTKGAEPVLFESSVRPLKEAGTWKVPGGPGWPLGGIATRATGGYHSGRHTPEVEDQCVIQARFEHRRRPAAILGGSKHDDRVGGLSFVHLGFLLNLPFDARHL